MTQLLANVGKGFSALKADSPGTQVVFERTVIAAVIVAALYLGRELFVPLAVSVLLAFSLSPVVRFMTRKLRLPRSLAVTATGLMTFAGLFAIGAVITNQVS
jgi:predicted PurR-regulated permease PerM